MSAAALTLSAVIFGRLKKLVPFGKGGGKIFHNCPFVGIPPPPQGEVGK